MTAYIYEVTYIDDKNVVRFKTVRGNSIRAALRLVEQDPTAKRIIRTKRVKAPIQ